MLSVTVSGNLLVRLDYHAFGRRQAANHLQAGNVVASTSYGYDPISRLSSLTFAMAGTSGDQALTFAYNPSSQIDIHPHPSQLDTNERSLTQRAEGEAVDRRNLYPSAQDFRHMNDTGAPFILKNPAGAILEGYRIGNMDHIAIIRQGSQPLGPIPDDLRGIIVDPYE